MISPFLNPIEHAKRVVGDSAGFVMSVAGYVGLGVVIWLQVQSPLRFVLLVVAVLFPISYLFALRKTLLELAKHTGDRDVRS